MKISSPHIAGASAIDVETEPSDERLVILTVHDRGYESDIISSILFEGPRLGILEQVVEKLGGEAAAKAVGIVAKNAIFGERHRYDVPVLATAEDLAALQSGSAPVSFPFAEAANDAIISRIGAMASSASGVGVRIEDGQAYLDIARHNVRNIK